MANLTVENLKGVLESGSVEGMMGGANFSSDAKVMREMRQNGMEIPPDALGTGRAAPGAVNAPGSAGEAGGSFSSILRDSVAKVNEYQQQSDIAIKELVAGRSKNIHETMLTIERADTSLKMMMQVRNKILDAYREIMRMQV